MSIEAISRFKMRHQTIVDLLDQIQVLSRSYFQAKPKIRELRERLLAHLSHKDDEFFDHIRLSYKGDRHSVKLIEFLAHDLKDIKIKYLVFFEQYSGELADIGSRNFPGELIRFSREVLGRIKIEEEYLFPLLQKLGPDE